MAASDFAVSFNSDTSDEDSDGSSGPGLCNGHTKTAVALHKQAPAMAHTNTFDKPNTNGEIFVESGHGEDAGNALKQDVCEVHVHADSGVIMCEVPDPDINVDIEINESRTGLQENSVPEKTVTSDDACFSFTIECSETASSQGESTSQQEKVLQTDIHEQSGILSSVSEISSSVKTSVDKTIESSETVSSQVVSDIKEEKKLQSNVQELNSSNVGSVDKTLQSNVQELSSSNTGNVDKSAMELFTCEDKAAELSSEQHTEQSSIEYSAHSDMQESLSKKASSEQTLAHGTTAGKLDEQLDTEGGDKVKGQAVIDVNVCDDDKVHKASVDKDDKLVPGDNLKGLSSELENVDKSFSGQKDNVEQFCSDHVDNLLIKHESLDKLETKRDTLGAYKSDMTKGSSQLHSSYNHTESVQLSEGASQLHTSYNHKDDMPVLHGEQEVSDNRDVRSKRSGLRMSSEEDGSRAYEKTTTFIAGDRQSTDELIKRILAESRGEVYTPPRDVTRRQLRRDIEGEVVSPRHDVDRSQMVRDFEGQVVSPRHNVTGGQLVHDFDMASARHETRKARRSHESEEDVFASDVSKAKGSQHSVEHETEPALQRHERIRMSPEHEQTRTPEAAQYSPEGQKELSLLERRLASMRSPHSDRGQEYLAESFEESYTGRRGAASRYYRDAYDGDSQGSGDYRGRQLRSQLMRQQQAQFHDYSDEDEEEERRRRQPEVEYIPDEEFVPQKAEDTDRVVQERTEEIRKVVDNQSSVLERLKSASDSFDEISSEIKEIKQQFLDSQMRRSMILDEISHERQMMEQEEYERAQYEPQNRGYGQSQSEPQYRGYGQSQPEPQYRGYASQRRGRYAQSLQDDNDEDFDSKYRPARSSQAQRQVELDKELESDRIGRGGLSGLAIGGGSSIDKYRSQLDTAFSSASHLYGKGGKAMQYEEEDMDSDISGGYRRGRLTRTHGGLDDSDTVDSSEPYRSPNLPSYRKYDYEPKTYDSTSYDSSRSYKSKGYDFSSKGYDSSSKGYGTSSKGYDTSSKGYDTSSYKSGYSQRSASSSRYGSLSRAKTMDSGLDSRSLDRSYSKYQPAEPQFSSRFLSKVREKKAAGQDIKADKGFSSRFLGKSFEASSTFARPSFDTTKDTSSVKSDTDSKNTSSVKSDTDSKSQDSKHDT